MITIPNLFSYSEDQGVHLKTIFYLVVVDFFITFSDWINQGYLTKQSVESNTAVCWPYFKECLGFYIFDADPRGYSLNALYLVLGSLLFGSLYFAYSNKYKEAFLLLLPPFFFKLLMIYFFSYLVVGNYNSLGLFIAAVLLFSKEKVLSLKVLLTVFYFCAAFIKFDTGYFSGDIFSSLNLGAPLLPNVFLPYYGILAFLLFLLSPILLWSKNKNIRMGALLSLSVFHIYSISFVGFRYPILCLPMIWVLFYFAEYRRFSSKDLFKEATTTIIVFFILFSQMIPILIKGDDGITSEGEKYGFYMFTANRQCVSSYTIFYSDKEKKNVDKESRRGMRRCDPYEDWFRIQNICKLRSVTKVTWTYNVSSNGSFFYKIVDTENACDLKNYHPFKHNSWIQLDTQDKTIPVLKNSM